MGCSKKKKKLTNISLGPVEMGVGDLGLYVI